jgi:hypothetical protein
MNGLTAHAAASTIAKYAGVSYPSEEEKAFELLTFAQNQIWRIGKFHNSTKFFYVKVYPDGTIITPHGYNVCLGIRINNKNVDLRGEHFLFHQNGPGDVLTYTSRNQLTDVYDLGESPVLFQPVEDENCCKKFYDNCPRVISVQVPGCEYYNGELSVLVSGLNQRGETIYTYETGEKNCEPQICKTEEEAQQYDDYVQGVKYPLSSKGVMWNNILFSRITNIFKHPSIVPVEIWMVHPNGTGVKIARLEPYQMISKYRIYKLPPSCGTPTVVSGLFKISEPDPIVHKNQIMLTRNREALISLAKSFDFKYNKDKMQESVTYLADAVGQLNAEVKENSSNELNPIQISTHHDGFKNFPRF